MGLLSARSAAAILLTVSLFGLAGLTSSAAIRPNRLDYQLATLPNGLTVVLSEDHSTPIVHVQLWYHVGSKNEKPGRTGFAHLFEHLMFKGSKNVQPEGHTSMISGRGGQSNAYTTDDESTRKRSPTSGPWSKRNAGCGSTTSRSAG
jgi:zinc protease